MIFGGGIGVRNAKHLLWSSALLAVLAAEPAYAKEAQRAQNPEHRQGADQSDASDQAPGADQHLQEIIVTAQKRSENVQKVPIAISVVDSEELQDRHIFEASQLQYVVPSLQQQSVNNQVGATNFSIRGVGTSIYGPAVESAVAVVIDGVALARPAMGVVQFFDLDRVEVLRGPQGMLFGKNASAGLINIVTARPRIGQLGGLAHLSYGKTNSGTAGNEAIAQAALNLPVSSDSALRVSGFFTRQDGFGRNIFRDEDLGLTEFGARAKYLWNATDRLELYFEGDYAHENGPGGSVLFRRYDAPGGFVAGQDAAAGITASPHNTRIASDAPTDNHFELGGVQGRATYRFDNGYSITNITAWRAYRDRSKLDTDQLPIDFFNVNDQGRDQRQFSNEFRVASPTGVPFEFQAGLYYLYVRDEGRLRQTANLRPIFPPAPPGFIGLFGGAGSSKVKNRSYAAFGQGRLSLTPSLRLIAGARLTHDDVFAVGSQTGAGYVIPQGPTQTLTGSLKKTNLSFRLGAEYDIARRVMAYATFARGYKTPTFGGATGTTAIKAEIPTNIELGLKSTLLDNRLIFNVALYHVLFKDFQAQAFDPALLRFTTTNAGSVRAQGVEIDFRALPITGFTLSGGLAYNDAIYKNYDGVACYFGEPTGTSGRNVCLPNGTTDVSGNRLAFAPKFTGSLLAEYEQPISSRLNAFVTGTYYYRSSVNFTAAHDPMSRVGAYSLFGGSVGVETADSNLRFSLFARNLFDKRIPTFIVADVTAPINGDAAIGGDYWQQFGETSFRTIGASLDVKF